MNFLASLIIAGLVFNGTTSYVSIPGSGTPVDNLTTEMTMATWIYPTSCPGTEADIISKWSTNQYLLNISESHSCRLSAAIKLSGINNPECGTTLTANAWYHVAVVFDNAGSTLQIFLGGTNCVFVSASGTMSASGANLFLGARDTTPTFAFPGIICEPTIWKVALKNSEIASLAAGVNPAKVRQTQQVMHIPGNVNGFDASGNHENGTLTNVTLGQHCPVGPPQ